MTDFGKWLFLLVSRWQIWASGTGLGGAGILILYIIERLREKTVDNIWYALLFVILFVPSASFIAWRDEHRRVVVLEKQLENTKPKLLAEFDVLAAAPVGEDNEVLLSEPPFFI